ncbi:hypothetical protein C8J35_11454 [Rhizobium sp. PP-F2F-G38]|uniref:hypothetical protein n=1 Tax=Rhizobium sp. PP-CC-3G-465 TaxID=2135648 RepID=UPI000D9D95AB|nr:hypothetical protein C8J37_11550 [Rhizobium sp. PP-WC-1G-195]PYE39506.1 hypothetical protein DFI02_12512 [Rhizobium sp. PP-F2F-G20b]PYE93332.1 hypothetical protein C8J35_11454 [Rhizobium sp. PP-F2F-G38]TCP75611.1 hypothetical protein C8J31_13112 [Rhizobium sp. PP-CC-2G-626]TCQ02541.1 hypothetical protein C8J34_11712 [Rhizobium sp. PP-F2F-G36]TCQ17241.1 hypothetical protein C8J33_11338 [Rhizobium sp. PP-CC-3G-465]
MGPLIAGTTKVTDGLVFLDALEDADERLYEVKTNDGSQAIGPDGCAVSMLGLGAKVSGN